MSDNNQNQMTRKSKETSREEKLKDFYRRNPHLVRNPFGLLAKGTDLENDEEDLKRYEERMRSRDSQVTDD